VLDIGANVGIFSVQSASLGAHVVAVEPNPTAFHRLVRTIKRNGLQSSIRPLACAIGSECGAANLVLDDGLSIHGRIDFESHEEHTPSIPVLTLDELVCRQGITSVDLLKIDTEGAEADILKGGFGILPRVHRIVLEYHSPVLLSRVRELLGAAGLEEVGKLELYRGDELGIIYFARH
jgi:FkbM family methyltransferase